MEMIKDMLRCCFNPKVLMGLAIVAVGIFLFAPSLALSALPVIVALACPLSMIAMAVVMGRGMGNSQATPGSGYTCPMHPEVHTEQPGRCPKCGMPLVAAPATVGSATLSREEQVALLQMRLRKSQEEQTGIENQLSDLTESTGEAATGEPEGSPSVTASPPRR